MSRRKDAADPARPEEHKEAELGDFEAYLGKPGKQAANADLYRQSLRELAEGQGYPALLVDGFFDRDLEIVRARSTTDRTRRKLMTQAELDADPKNWIAEKAVKARTSS